MKTKQTDLNDIVGDISDNEGSIQEIFGFDTEIQITNTMRVISVILFSVIL